MSDLKMKIAKFLWQSYFGRKRISWGDALKERDRLMATREGVIDDGMTFGMMNIEFLVYMNRVFLDADHVVALLKRHPEEVIQLLAEAEKAKTTPDVVESC